MDPATLTLADAPDELAAAVREFFPEDQWDAAARIAYLESGWRWDAELDTRGPGADCGAPIGRRDGVVVTAEWSIGWFQINACNLPPGWKAAHLFNTRQNVGTAHWLYAQRGWQPWYFSAQRLGLI